MNTATTSFEAILAGVEVLNPTQLDLLQAQIARSKQNKTVAAQTASIKSVFEISYTDYLAFSESEHEALQWRVYREHHHVYQAELKARRAQWLIVCGKQIIEYSRILEDYPPPEKLRTIGRERNLIPFVFVSKPLIEESSWSALDEDDFYPTLRLQCSRFSQATSITIPANLALDADLDTGSPHLFVDYNRLAQDNVLAIRPKAEAFFEQHLGEFYRFHILPFENRIGWERA